MAFDREQALSELATRRAEHKDKDWRAHNQSLHAGEPMYFGCCGCNAVADVLPEDYNPTANKPKMFCDKCEELKTHGLLDRQPV